MFAYIAHLVEQRPHSIKAITSVLYSENGDSSSPAGSMITKKCETCKVDFLTKENTQKYCSHGCAAKTTNVGRKLVRQLDQQQKYCKNCCQPISNRKIGYCSNRCQKVFETYQRIIASEMEVTSASHRAYRNYLIHTHGAKCMKCGWDEKNPITDTVPIEMNHIDGNSSNTKLANLELLCPNCHSLTPSHRGLNRGNGRFLRAQRYRDGKSF